MHVSFSFSYIAAYLFCMTGLALLAFSTRDVERDDKSGKWFIATLVFQIIYFGVDAIWALLFTGTIPRTQAAVAVLNVAMGVLLNAVCISLFNYVMMRER